MEDKEETSLGLTEASGVLLMLNKDERLVIKELLVLTLRSESIKNYLREKLGSRSKPGVGRKKQLPKGFSDYVQVAENLLKNMGHKIPEKTEKHHQGSKTRSDKKQKKPWIHRKDGSYILEDSEILEVEKE